MKDSHSTRQRSWSCSSRYVKDCRRCTCAVLELLHIETSKWVQWKREGERERERYVGSFTYHIIGYTYIVISHFEGEMIWVMEGGGMLTHKVLKIKHISCTHGEMMMILSLTTSLGKIAIIPLPHPIWQDKFLTKWSCQEENLQHFMSTGATEKSLHAFPVRLILFFHGMLNEQW